nr:aldolase/citrate lyase family protein [Rhizobium leguminosarum]
MDMQHGMWDMPSAANAVAQVRLAGKPALARIPVGDFASASRLLDAGASGIIAPMINSAEDAQAFVRTTKYPPLGDRSWGPSLALNHTGLSADDYLKNANALTVAIAMVETRAALEAIDDIRDDADVVVAFGTGAQFGAIGTMLLREKVVPVCTQGFLDRNGPFDNPKQLAEAILIHLDTPMPSPWFDWQSYFTEFSVIRDAHADRGDISFNSYSLVVQAALSEQGVAIGWMGLVDTLLQARMLVEASPPLEAADHGYWLVPPRSASTHSEKLSTWLMNEAGKVV